MHPENHLDGIFLTRRVQGSMKNPRPKAKRFSLRERGATLRNSPPRYTIPNYAAKVPIVMIMNKELLKKP